MCSGESAVKNLRSDKNVSVITKNLRSDKCECNSIVNSTNRGTITPKHKHCLCIVVTQK